MRTCRRKGPCRERGQALVETALSMLIILVLLAGLVDFGIAFGYRVALANAARAGARYGSRYPTVQPVIRLATVEALLGTLVLDATYREFDEDTGEALETDPRLHIAIVCEDAGAVISCGDTTNPPNLRGKQIRVTAGYDYQPLFGGLLGIGDVPISAEALMYILGPD